MGNVFPAPAADVPEPNANQQGVKRTLDTDDEEADKFQEEQLHTPKKRKLHSTSRYIYETLFIGGENSDVKIVALGKSWLLHKVYLCQSTYFSSMFSGSWKESSQDVITMDIPDDNIDQEALDVAFGSLYKDDIDISPIRVSSVLAAATLLGLEGLIQQCAAVMKETVSVKTVCYYHSAAQTYGQQDVCKHCVDWLLYNLLTANSLDLLRDLSPSLVEQIVSSSELFVIQVELDIYSLLKKWLFVQLTPSWTGPMKDLTDVVTTYFKQRKGLYGDKSLLETDEALHMIPVFKGLRLQYIVNDINSAKIIEEDNIIPRGWLYPLYRKQWMHMLRVEQTADKGPEAVEMVDFSASCMRCGRILPREGEFCWRWTGFNYGLDLLVSFTKRLVILKRNTQSQNSPGSVSLQPKRHFLYRLTIASFDKLGNTTYLKSTGVKRLSLGPDEESIVLGVERQVSFPLYVSCNFLVYTTRAQSSLGITSPQNLNQSEQPAEDAAVPQAEPT